MARPVASGAGHAPAQAETPPGSVALADAQRLLSLFAQGLCGRYLHLKPTESLTGEFRPEGATTDGQAIYLPACVALFSQPRHNLGVYRVSVLHQLGFYENGTFGFSLAALRARMPALPKEPPPQLGMPPDLERFFGLWGAPALMRRLFMTLEDLRIDSALLRRYPGARADLQRVMAHALAHRPAMPDTLGQPVAFLFEALVRFTLGASPESLIASDPTGLLAPMLSAAARLRAPDADVHETAIAAVLCLRSFAHLMRQQAEADTGNEHALPEGTSEQGLTQPGSNPAEPDEGDAFMMLPDDAFDGMPVDFRGELRPELVQRQLRGGNTGVLEDAQAAEAPGQTPEDPVQRQRMRHADQAALRRAFGEADKTARSYLYDEWDFHHQRYLKGWCRLFEYRLRDGEGSALLETLRSRHGALALQVKRQLRFIRPDAYHRVRRVSDGEEIELDGVIEAAVDRRAGYATDEHVYRRRDRALREVSAAFLLDMSASTDFAVPDPLAPPPPPEPPPPPDGEFVWGAWNGKEDLAPDPPKRRVIDVARESLGLMAQALETLGDSYAIYGFSGYGREDVEFHIAKDFNDRLDARAWSAMAAMQPRRSTRMGPAIRHALDRLAAQPSRLKLLIMVSDGYPQDRDYGPDRNDDEYGIQDTAQALREVERAGVQSFCVTVDPAGHDYLRRMCPQARYLVIDEVNALPGELVKLYRALTA